jgi:hypothetical protein
MNLNKATVMQVVQEAANRRMDALLMFRPMAHQEPFFLNEATQTGIFGGNQTGKSTLAAVKFAAVARGKCVTFKDGRKIAQRRRGQDGRELLMWVVGLQLNHIGETIHRLLFRPGAFKIIKDKTTGLYRSWNPSDPEDKARESECKPAPPLIPESEIESSSWHNKGSKQFDCVTLKNGTRIVAYASTAEVKQGDQVDFIWIDESIQNPKHYDEWLMRLIAKRGFIQWSSWPTKGINSALIGLHELSQREEGKEKPAAKSFYFDQVDNPYLPKEMLDEIWGTGQMDEDTRKTRGRGMFLVDNWLMYPRFNEAICSALPENPDEDDALAKVLRKSGGIPPSWTRYMVLDPGTVNPGVLFVAVPPPELGNFIVPYREIKEQHIDADQLAKLIKNRIEASDPPEQIESFVIDGHAARIKPMGFSLSIGANYSVQFKKYGIHSVKTGTGFTYGSDDVDSRIMKLQAAMALDDLGRCKLRIYNCPGLVKQILNYRREADSAGNPTDKPAKRQVIDLAVCLEYFVSRSDLVYVKPKPRQVRGSSVDSMFNEFFSHFDKTGPVGRSSIVCGPGLAK